MEIVHLSVLGGTEIGLPSVCRGVFAIKRFFFHYTDNSPFLCKNEKVMRTLLNVSQDEFGNIYVRSDVFHVEFDDTQEQDWDLDPDSYLQQDQERDWESGRFQRQERASVPLTLPEPESRRVTVPEPLPDLHPELTRMLKEWRREKARELNVSAYIVINNRVLQSIANALPAGAEELLAIHGVGPATLERYGAEILSLVESYLDPYRGVSEAAEEPAEITPGETRRGPEASEAAEEPAEISPEEPGNAPGATSFPEEPEKSNTPTP